MHCIIQYWITTSVAPSGAICHSEEGDSLVLSVLDACCVLETRHPKQQRVKIKPEPVLHLGSHRAKK